MRRHPVLWAMLCGALILGATILWVPTRQRAFVVAGVFLLLVAALLYAYRTRRELWKVAAGGVAAVGLLAHQVSIELASLLLTVPLVFTGLAVALRPKRRRDVVQVLFFCRFPLLHGGLLLLLAGVGVSRRPEMLDTLVGNLFDVAFFKGFVLVVFLAALAGAVVALGGILVTRSAAAWLGDPSIAGRQATLAWMAFGAAGPLGIATALLLRSPLPAGPKVLAVACGGGAAALVLLIGRFVAILLDPRAEARGWRPMRWAAGRQVTPARRLVEGVESRLREAPDALARGYFSQGQLERGHLAAFTTGALVLLLYILGYRVLDPGGRFEPPAMSYLLLLILVTASLLPLVSFFLDRFRIPTTAAVVVLPALLYFLNDLDHYYPLHPAPAEAETQPAEAAVAQPRGNEVATAFRARLRRSFEAAPERRPTVVVVAASGGGITASLWTTAVIEELNRQFGRELIDSIHLVSTVSGGSVGGMFLVDALERSRDGEPLDDLLRQATDRSARSSLAATAWGLAYPDLLRALSLTPDPERDRGWAQERVWEEELGRPSPTLADWREPVRDGELPLLILNATLCETGERYLLSPLRLIDRRDCDDSRTECHDSFAGASPWSLYGTAGLPVVTAARLSATFPFVSPIARPGRDVPDERAYHVADGGYYDNFGVSTAVEWLRHAFKVARRAEKAGLPEPRFLLLEVRASERGLLRRPAQAGAGWVYASLGPAMTLFNVRNSSQIDRNDQEVALLIELAEKLGFELETVDLTLRRPDTPLSWHLSEDEVGEIRDEARQLGASFDEIEQFLARGRTGGG